MNYKDHYLEEKNKKFIGLMKDELIGKLMTEFAALRPKAYIYLANDSVANAKEKGTRKRVIKRKLKGTLMQI